MKPYYEDEFCTIYHGDCRDVLLQMDAGVLVTDPPYGIRYTPAMGGNQTKSSQTAVAYCIVNDGDSSVRDEVLKLWGDRPAMVFGNWRVSRPPLTKHRLIWHKGGMAPGPTNFPFMSNDEEIYVWGDGFISTSPPLRSVLRTDEARSIEVARIGHPTPKPVDLMRLLINRCEPNLTILDPFMGSGSTLRAAKDLGRKAIGIEIEKRYCEIAAKRLQQEVLPIYAPDPVQDTTPEPLRFDL